MSIVNTLKEQHRNLASLARGLRGELDAQLLSRDAREVRTLLSGLVGVLRVHLSSEDNVLYPRLLESANSEVCETAKRFVAEMGGLSTTLAEFVARWPHAGAIQSEAELFVEQTSLVLDALEERIRNEESLLYPLLDK